MEHLKKNISKVLHSRIVQHSFFWMLSFYILLQLFSKEYGDTYSELNFVYTFLFHLSLFFVVYLNLHFLIPKFLSRGKPIHYLIALSGLMIIGVYFNLLIFSHLSNILFPDFFFISFYQFYDIFQFILAYVVLTTLIKLSKAWFQLRENNRRLDKLEKEKLDAELSALKSQINPHFLFNSLHNLYSLALDKDEKTPDVILKLSEGMRYMLYETNEHFVPLEKEIQYLKNYIDLQKLRIDEKANIDLEISGTSIGLQIAPLLFIPFVENGFKHGIKGDTENAYIQIALDILDNGIISFKVENNKGEIDETENPNYKGVGLKNVKRRLELLYPEKYELKINDGIKHFLIELKLELS